MKIAGAWLEKKPKQRKCLHIRCCSYPTSSSFLITIYYNTDSLKQREQNSLKQKWFELCSWLQHSYIIRPGIKLLPLTSHYQSTLNTVVGLTHGYVKTAINPLPPVLYLYLCNLLCTDKNTSEDEFKLWLQEIFDNF